jgi:hypothetical protein
MNDNLISIEDADLDNVAGGLGITAGADFGRLGGLGLHVGTDGVSGKITIFGKTFEVGVKLFLGLT